MLHFALGHFPIALLVTGGAVLLGAVILSNSVGRNAALAMLVVGAALSIPTVAAGLWIAGAHEGHHGDVLAIHRLLGIATMIVALLALVSHMLRRRVANADLACNLLFFAAAVLAGSTGFVGAEMAHPAQERAGNHAHASEVSVICSGSSTETGCTGVNGGSGHGDVGHGHDTGGHGDTGHAHDKARPHAH